MALSELVPLPAQWNQMKNSKKEVCYIELNDRSKEYKKVKELVNLDKIIDIYRIQNKYVYGRYLLKKYMYGIKGKYEERTLLHATNLNNVACISAKNFDYRLVKRGKYGKGVSFTHISSYANKKGCHNSKTTKRAMIVAKVLVGKGHLGWYGLKVPKDKYDTTTREGGLKKTKVIVKFIDDEYYPEYFVYYDCSKSDGQLLSLSKADKKTLKIL